eukprot:403341280
MTLIYRQFCEEECILYSADLNLKTNLIAGGTVFRTILIWKNLDQDINQEQQPQVQQKVLYKLEGHAGVLFDVRFLTDSIVASVSDDRSLRIWKLDLENVGQYQQVCEYYGHRSRVWRLDELGYDGMLVTVSEDATCRLWEKFDIESQEHKIVNRSIETLKGHQGKNIRALTCYEGMIATGGDDGAVKIWNAKDIMLQKQQNEQNSQTQVHRFNIEKPSPKVLPIVQEEAKLQEPVPVQEESKVEETQDGQDQTEQNIAKKKKKSAPKPKPEDIVNQIRAIDILEITQSDKIDSQNSSTMPIVITGTNKGTITAFESKSQVETLQYTLYQDSLHLNIQDIQVLQISGQNIVAVSIGEGTILVFNAKRGVEQEKIQLELIEEIKASDIKILNLFLFEESNQGQEQSSQFSLIGTNGRAELLKFTFIYQPESQQFNNSNALAQKFKVAIKTQFICLQYIQNRNVFVTGDSKGNLFLFDTTHKPQQLQSTEEVKIHDKNLQVEQDQSEEQKIDKSEEQFIMNYQQLKAHKNERVLSIYYDHEKQNLYSTSKDNYINMYSFDNHKQIQKTQSIKEEDLNIIYNINMMNQKMVLLGYYGNFAYIWNKQENMQIFSIDTKGGNRPMKLKVQNGQHISEQQYGRHFIYAYSFGDCLTLCNNWLFSNDLEHQIPVENQFTIKDSLHGREILAACGFSLSQNKSIVLTGSEDSFLKVSEYDSNTQALNIAQTFSNHVASIRTIAKAKIHSEEQKAGIKQYIVLSAGSRMQANVFQVTIKEQNFEMSHICNFIRSSEQDEEQDFRINSSCVINKSLTQNHISTGDSNHLKLLTLCAFGNSNGDLQVFTVNYKKCRLEDLYKIQLASSILSMKRVKLNDDQYLIICGLSNGDIYVLAVDFIKNNETQEIETHIQPHAELNRVHDFGVNTLDAIYDKDSNELLIVSGGDDQQISVIKMKRQAADLEQNSQTPKTNYLFTIASKLKQYAHSSCIKGVVITQQSPSEYKIVSSSYDQRYREQVLNKNEEDLTKLSQSRVVRHCMSDMNGICKISNYQGLPNSPDQIVLVGQGLAIFQTQ